jgi:hypothetical protein
MYKKVWKKSFDLLTIKVKSNNFLKFLSWMKLDRAESNIIVKQKREIIGVQLNWNTNETKRNFKWLNWLQAMFGQMYFKGSLKDWIRSTITLHSATRHNLNFKYAEIFFLLLARLFSNKGPSARLFKLD